MNMGNYMFMEDDQTRGIAKSKNHLYICIHTNKIIMIQLFEYEDIEIRTDVLDGKIWFSGQDIFFALDLTWKGAYDIRRRNIPESWVTKRSTQTVGGLQDMVFISEQAVYMIAFSSQKTEKTIKFSIWVAELLTKLNQMIREGRSNDIKKFLDTDVQKGYSKLANKKSFSEGGVEKTVEYNTKNCVLHTGMTPSKVKEVGKNRGLKSKDISSAKQVLRVLKPELACSMSFTDKLVTEDGVEHELAARTSKEYAAPLFKQLMSIGVSMEEIDRLSK